MKNPKSASKRKKRLEKYIEHQFEREEKKKSLKTYKSSKI